MQERRKSNEPMDLSGRSAGSSSSSLGMPSQAGFALPQMMSQQPRFQPPGGSPFQQRGFTSSPSQQQQKQQQQQQQQQQRYYQMQQLQQLRMQQIQQQQQQPPSSPRNPAPYQMSPSQQQQRRPSSSSGMSAPSPRSPAPPPTTASTTTTSITGEYSPYNRNATASTNHKASSVAISNSASNQQTAATSGPSAGSLSKMTLSLSKPSANANEATTASKKAAAKPTSGKTATKSTSHKSTTSTTATATKMVPTEPLAPEQVQQLLSQTNWVDRTLWVSRQLLGGHALNGFLRATATAQRVKKQRARQTAAARAKQQATISSSNHNNPIPNDPNGKNAAATTTTTTTTAAGTAENSNLSVQEAEEVLKKEVMNARTAKKFKTEMEAGLQFCEMLHGTIRTILNDMDPVFVPPPPLDKALPNPKAKNLPPPSMMPPAPPPVAPRNTMSSTISAASNSRRGLASASSLPPPSPLQQQRKLMSSLTGPQTAPPGNNAGSMLRKQRRKKLPPSNEPPVVLSEYDESGKKKFSKKEQLHRVAEVIRFRALRKGDFVAARLSSRDLWILARVLNDYNSFDIPPAKFLQLSGPRRDQLFREKVMIEDVEDKQDGTPVLVSRSLVLPLPRSFSEAAEWGARVKKGTRVYAMYPQTTSLYSATVVDNTTYCREDDDIIVVEFDGDEPDATGLIPKCHIPARFVVIIPREFPASQPISSGKKRKDSSQHGSTASKKAATASSSKAMVQSVPASLLDDSLNLDDINFDNALQGLDGFDDLDFDLLGGS